jgi:hypothetical protein
MPGLFPDRFNDEFQTFMIGTKLGEGVDREVYVFRGDTTKVIKIEKPGVEFSNVEEWTVWHEALHADVQDWFAPCYGISEGGRFLIQARTKPIERLPDKLPSFMTDIKRENFGRLPDGRIVAHDYSRHQLYTRGFANWRLKKVAKVDHER